MSLIDAVTKGKEIKSVYHIKADSTCWQVIFTYTDLTEQTIAECLTEESAELVANVLELHLMMGEV